MKNPLSALALVAALLLPVPAMAGKLLVCTTQIVEHPSLDAMREGFRETLKARGLEVEYKVYTAQGSMDMAVQIANQIRGDRPDLILAIATPTAQAVVQKIKDIPVLFTGITDPLAAGLVKNMEKPGGNVSGMTDKSPVDRQMALIREILPAARTIGVLYNAGEPNSVISFGQIKAECAKLGLAVEARTVSTSAEVYAAAKSLVGKVDAVTVPTDSTVVAVLESVIKVCEEARIPLFAADTDTVQRGALAAVAVDYRRMGVQTGEMAVRILKDGAKPADMPVESLRDLQLYVNLPAAARYGVTLPEALVRRADKVIR